MDKNINNTHTYLFYSTKGLIYICGNACNNQPFLYLVDCINLR